MKLTVYPSIHERFSYLIETLGYTQVSLAQLIGISQGYVSQLMTGQRSITTKILRNITKLRPEVNINWVLTGDGEMFLSNMEPSNQVQEQPPAYLQNGQGMLESLIRRVEELERWKEKMERKLK